MNILKFIMIAALLFTLIGCGKQGPLKRSPEEQSQNKKN